MNLPAPPPAEQLPTDGGAEAGLRPLVVYSLASSLCPLLPVPFVDDWLRDRLRRRLALVLAAEHGLRLDDRRAMFLANGSQPVHSLDGCLRGCLSGAALKTVFYVGKKLFRSVFRKLLLVLAIKDCADTFSATFHQGYLLRHALRTGRLHPRPDADPALRHAIERTCAEVDTRLIETLFKRSLGGSRRLLRHAAGTLRRVGRRRADADAEGEARAVAAVEDQLDPLIDRLTASLAGQGGYLRALVERFDSHLTPIAERPPDAAPGGPPAALS